MKRSREIAECPKWRVPMAVSTKKSNSGRKVSSSKKAERHYERTVVEPAARLIAAMNGQAFLSRPPYELSLDLDSLTSIVRFLQ